MRRQSAAAILFIASMTQANERELWTFDRLDRIGGHPTTVEGGPVLIETPVGNAVEFDGVDDAVFVEAHPLAGTGAFTWEAIFRPDGGQEAQRWFHLQESDSENRLLLEIRVLNGKWYLDSYLHSGEQQKALMDSSRVHPLLAWYHVAAVYDGREFRNYVNGVQQGAAVVGFAPQKNGRASIGTRMNRVSYFKGAVRAARFTRRALAPAEFLKLEGAWQAVSFATSDGGTIHGDLYGTGGRGVVLVHGGRFDKASWGMQAQALTKAGFRVLAIDLRGYGRSRGPGDSDLFTAPLQLDVLAAVRYLRSAGVTTVSLVGASIGGDAAASAAADAAPGEIDRLVMLAATTSRPPESLPGRTLFIVAEGDLGSGDVPRLPKIREQYESARGPKELVVLDGDAHAQLLFATAQRERLTQEIVRFLSAR
jgi:alpha/beta superfamily hydrolase